MYEPANELTVLIAYAQMPLINAHTDASSRARGQNFDQSPHPYPYFVYAKREGSGESALMRLRIRCSLML